MPPRQLHKASTTGLVAGRLPQVVLLGNQAVEPKVGGNLVGTVEAFAFRARRAGTAASIRVYLDARDRTATLFAGLYSSRHGHPQSLLTSGLRRSPKAGAWNSVAVGSASLRSGTTYWLAVLGKSGAIYFRDRNGRSCTSEKSSKRKLRSLPRTWPVGPKSHVCQISAYVQGAARSSSTGTSGASTPVLRTSAPTGTISAPTSTTPARRIRLLPVATAAPAVSGQAVQGQTLSTTNGSWTNSPTSYAYRWQDCDSSGANCTSISGATSSSYTLVSGDVGHTIRAVVTATNAGGSGSATSTQTVVVACRRAAVEQHCAGDQRHSAVQGRRSRPRTGRGPTAPPSYQYAWQDCDSSGEQLHQHQRRDLAAATCWAAATSATPSGLS